MSKPNLTMAVAFASSYPDEAARTLELQKPETSAKFLDTYARSLPPELLQRMLPNYVSRLCTHLEPRRLSEIFAEADASFIAAILRTLPVNQRNSILGYLSTAKRAAVQLLLNFPDDSVGSRMNPNVVTLPIDSDADTARRFVKMGGNLMESERLFVVDRDRRLLGFTSHVELAQAKKKQPLTSILEPDTRALLSRTTIETAALHSAWAQADIMPVINRNQHFIGAIRHVDLRKARDEMSNAHLTPEKENPISDFAKAYGNTYLALYNSVEELIRDKGSSGGSN